MDGEAQSALITFQGELALETIVQDVSSRRAAEKELQASEARFREIAEAAGGYTWETDQEYRYTFVSGRSEALFGYAPVEMIGHTPAEFMPPGEQAAVTAWIAANRSKDGSVRFLEHRSVTKSGTIFWQQVHMIPMRAAAGNVIGCRGTGIDITARKHAEAARSDMEAKLRDSQKMQAIGTLAGGIAHDFNNIIAIILGNTELALQDSKGNARLTGIIEEIAQASRRGRNLVQQILSFSRRQSVEREPLVLNAIVEESAKLLRTTLPARISLQVQCAVDVPAVLANATQIQQVIINLATNAMHAIGSAYGRIDIRLDTVVLDEQLSADHPGLKAILENQSGRAVRLLVQDTGPGMDEGTLARIYEPFFTTKPVNEGTGLGLSVVHGIVEGHGGRILVDSQPGKGTSFTVYLPVTTAKANVAMPEKGYPATDAPAGHHVLYLDDDPALVTMVKMLLGRHGLRVSGFSSQEEALAAVRAEPMRFDLVISDYNMPEMTGLDVARQIRAIRADLPVAIASGYIDEELRNQAQGAGVRELILKAEAMDGFYEVVQRLIETSSLPT